MARPVRGRPGCGLADGLAAVASPSAAIPDGRARGVPGGVLAVGLGRAPATPAAGEKLRARAALEAGGAPILADDINAEALALDGRLVWIANPLDAFALPDQRLYLDWIAGRKSGDALPASFPAALVTVDSPAAVRLAGNGGWCGGAG